MAEAETNLLYFFAQPEKYRSAKVNLLGGKSGVLILREKIKKIKVLQQKENESREKVIKLSNKIKLDLKKLSEILPKAQNKKLGSKLRTIDRAHFYKPTIKSPQDEIKRELEDIDRRIAELSHS